MPIKTAIIQPVRFLVRCAKCKEQIGPVWNEVEWPENDLLTCECGEVNAFPRQKVNECFERGMIPKPPPQVR